MFDPLGHRKGRLKCCLEHKPYTTVKAFLPGLEE